MKTTSIRNHLMLLAVASGSADVIAFLLLGQVFASAMTGNTALLGIALSNGNWVAMSQPFFALFGFAAGVGFATLIGNPQSPGQERVMRNLLVLEIACLAAFAILLQIGHHAAGEPTQYALILLGSFAMGIQGAVAKRMDAPGVNTIVFTTTFLTIISSAVGILSGRKNDPAIRSSTLLQISAYGAYGGGALLAGLLYWAEFALLPWLPLVAVVVVVAMWGRR